jgi:hypothetical protein
MKLVLKSKPLTGLLCLLSCTPGLLSGSGTTTKVYADETIISSTVVANPKIASNAPAPVSANCTSISIYQQLHLKRYGLSKSAFNYALKGYQHLQEQGSIVKKNLLSICDFSQSSRRKRFYIIDLSQQKVLVNTYVAHGRNSGAEYATSFSNSEESHKSSLGFYITKNTYWGDHGLSLRIAGVEDGFNDKAYERNIVIHGSEYVGAGFIKNNPFNGRSFGCPALPAYQTPLVINTIKEGTCLFIYHPSKKYLINSKILNG